jgi:hypothetical protein
MEETAVVENQLLYTLLPSLMVFLTPLACKKLLRTFLQIPRLE